MAKVSELSEPYGAFLISPRPGADVCSFCFNLTRGYRRCYSCASGGRQLAVLAPLSYSIGHEQLHCALTAYKRLSGELAERLALELAAVLWRFLAAHEGCLARAAAVSRFHMVTTIPSSHLEPSARDPLRTIVGELVGPTRDRYVPLLRRSRLELPAHKFDTRKFEALRSLDGQAILLVDDTWTTGASSRSAVAALRQAGAGTVAQAVIGRYLNRHWHHNEGRLRELRGRFDWSRCPFCSGEPG